MCVSEVMCFEAGKLAQDCLGSEFGWSVEVESVFNSKNASLSWGK